MPGSRTFLRRSAPTPAPTEWELRPGARCRAAVSLVGLALVLVGCSSATTTPTTTSTTGGSSNSSVGVDSANRSNLGAILVTRSGDTLYRYTPDGTGAPTCNGTCASVWPPLTIKSGASPTAGTGVPQSDLGTAARTGGSEQVTFKGMPLYTYTGDSAPGQTNGQGLEGTWYVVNPASTSSTTSTTGASGAAGY